MGRRDATQDYNSDKLHTPNLDSSPPSQTTQMSQTFSTKFYISTFRQFKLLTFSFDVGYWSFVQGSFCRLYHILTFAKVPREDVR